MLQTDPASLPRADVPEEIWDVLNRLTGAAAALAARIARGDIDRDSDVHTGENLGAAVGVNAGGDGQKALDLIADDAFVAALRGSSVIHYASEEQDDILVLGAAPAGMAAHALAIDPLDGSSNIDVNVSIGTIFGLFPAGATPEASFFRPGSDLIAAGYFIYGPQTCLVVGWGAGLRQYTLDARTGRFALTAGDLRIPVQSNEYAINASNYHHWPAPVRAYIDDLVRGAEGPHGRAFNMRWIASLVAETHRIIHRGGIFLYPGDARKGYAQGRLRLLYECAPIAFLMAEGGGAATDGTDPILARPVDALHMRTPFAFGSLEKVARLAAYHDLPASETSALFGKRGLFRT